MADCTNETSSPYSHIPDNIRSSVYDLQIMGSGCVQFNSRDIHRPRPFFWLSIHTRSAFKVKDFFKICHNCQFDRIFLFLHGWEWVALLGIAAWITGWNPWITGTFIGLGQHIFLDSFYNASGFKSYSLFWRWKNNFEFDKIFHGLTDRKYEYRNNLQSDSNPDWSLSALQ